MGSGSVLADRRQDHCLQMHAVAHGDHDFLKVEERLGGRRWRLAEERQGCEQNDNDER